MFGRRATILLFGEEKRPAIGLETRSLLPLRRDVSLEIAGLVRNRAPALMQELKMPSHISIGVSTQIDAPTGLSTVLIWPNNARVIYTESEERLVARALDGLVREFTPDRISLDDPSKTHRG